MGVGAGDLMVEELVVRWGGDETGPAVGVSWMAGGFANEILVRGTRVEFASTVERAVPGDASPVEGGDVIEVQELGARDGVKVLILQKGGDRIVLSGRRITWTPDRPL